MTWQLIWLPSAIFPGRSNCLTAPLNSEDILIMGGSMYQGIMFKGALKQEYLEYSQGIFIFNSKTLEVSQIVGDSKGAKGMNTFKRP